MERTILIFDVLSAKPMPLTACKRKNTIDMAFGTDYDSCCSKPVLMLRLSHLLQSGCGQTLQHSDTSIARSGLQKCGIVPSGAVPGVALHLLLQLAIDFNPATE